MEKVSVKSDVSLREAEEHYQLSSENYTIEGAESHLTFYRDRHPKNYRILLNHYSN